MNDIISTTMMSPLMRRASIKFNPIEHQLLGERIMNEVVFAAGFGQMPKSTIELVIIDFLRRLPAFKDKSSFEWSILLGISETKVNNLIYNAALRYGPIDNIPEDLLLLKYVCLAKYNGDDVQMLIEDKYDRMCIMKQIKELNEIVDTSFNKEIIRIKRDTLVKILERCYLKTDEDKEKLLNGLDPKVRKMLKEDDTYLLDKLLKKFLEGVAKGLGSKLVDLLVPGASFVSLISNIFTSIIK